MPITTAWGAGQAKSKGWKDWTPSPPPGIDNATSGSLHEVARQIQKLRSELMAVNVTPERRLTIQAKIQELIRKYDMLASGS